MPTLLLFLTDLLCVLLVECQVNAFCCNVFFGLLGFPVCVPSVSLRVAFLVIFPFLSFSPPTVP